MDAKYVETMLPMYAYLKSKETKYDEKRESATIPKNWHQFLQKDSNTVKLLKLLSEELIAQQSVEQFLIVRTHP